MRKYQPFLRPTLADLPGIGGVQILSSLIQPGKDPALQAEAAFVLGTAASNNAKFQAEVAKVPHLLSHLLQVRIPSKGSI